MSSLSAVMCSRSSDAFYGHFMYTVIHQHYTELNIFMIKNIDSFGMLMKCINNTMTTFTYWVLV